MPMQRLCRQNPIQISICRYRPPQLIQPSSVLSSERIIHLLLTGAREPSGLLHRTYHGLVRELCDALPPPVHQQRPKPSTDALCHNPKRASHILHHCCRRQNAGRAPCTFVAVGDACTAPHPSLSYKPYSQSSNPLACKQASKKIAHERPAAWLDCEPAGSGQ